MAKEQKLETQLVAYCKEHGIYTRKFVSPGHAGVPDRIIVGPSDTVFLELKAPGQKPTPLQMNEIDEILRRGGRAYWASSWEGARAVLEVCRWSNAIKPPINADDL